MLNKLIINKDKLCKRLSGLVKKGMTLKHPGIDGILVTVGLCIIALVLCVLMKDKLAVFIGTIVSEMTDKASTVLKMNS